MGAKHRPSRPRGDPPGGLAACDSAAENEAEENIEEMEDARDNQVDAMEEAGEITEDQADVMDDQTDAMEESMEEQADEIDEM